MEEEREFKVVDKRRFAREGGDTGSEERDVAGPETGTREEEKTVEKEVTNLPPPDFTSFILSLSTSALLHLGEVPNPLSGEEGVKKNIPIARHTIDVIEMLSEKTKGNLTEEENKILGEVLYDLRMRYVKAVG